LHSNKVSVLDSNNIASPVTRGQILLKSGLLLEGGLLIVLKVSLVLKLVLTRALRPHLVPVVNRNTTSAIVVSARKHRKTLKTAGVKKNSVDVKRHN